MMAPSSRWVSTESVCANWLGGGGGTELGVVGSLVAAVTGPTPRRTVMIMIKYDVGLNTGDD